jgi:hypothetical protein
MLTTEEIAHDAYNIAPGLAWDTARWVDRLKTARPGFDVEMVATPEGADIVEHTTPERMRTPVGNDRIRELITGFPRHDPDAALDDYLRWIESHADFVTDAVG